MQLKLAKSGRWAVLRAGFVYKQTQTTKTPENLTQDQGRREAESGSMSSFMYRFFALSLMAGLVLSACMDGSNGTTSRDGSSRQGGASAERDVENPSAFSRRENALWDGRPSLGGVWVAHPDVSSPERVIIRNTTNGQETIGALFRRERMNPGPAFQVSGEAAGAIGILAGAPTMIEVVALRVEEAQPEPVDTIETAEPEPVAAPPPEAPGAQQIASADDMTIALPEADTPAARPQRGLFGRMFGRRDAEPAPSSDDMIETTALDAATPAADADTAAPPMPSPLATAPAVSSLERPYIQLGIFSVEANAENAARMARGASLSARVVSGSAQGNTFWRVVVGPATTATEQSQMLARVRTLGFNDAYLVRR